MWVWVKGWGVLCACECVCMYKCLYVCMYVCMYVSTVFVCTYVTSTSIWSIISSQLFQLLCLLFFEIFISFSYFFVMYVRTYLQAGNMINSMVNHHGSYTQQHVRSTQLLNCFFLQCVSLLIFSFFMLLSYNLSHLHSSLSPLLSSCLLSLLLPYFV